MVVIALADGFEELEAFSPFDILKRGGAQVVTAGVPGREVKSARGLSMLCDIRLSDIPADEIEILLLPGGPGHENLKKSPELKGLIRTVLDKGKLLAAICAAPSILGEMGLLSGKKACCFPGYEEKLIGVDVVYDRVVVDPPFITSRGAGTAADFAFELLTLLKGKEISDKIRNDMLF